MKLDKSGDSLCGNYYSATDNYLITSIPYDKAFTVLVDNNAVQTECVNKAFLEAKVSSGKHKIEIIYVTKGSVAGLIITSALLLITFMCILNEKIKQTRRKSKS